MLDSERPSAEGMHNDVIRSESEKRAAVPIIWVSCRLIGAELSMTTKVSRVHVLCRPAIFTAVAFAGLSATLLGSGLMSRDRTAFRIRLGAAIPYSR